MAETSAGGCIPPALTSAASTRAWPSGSGAPAAAGGSPPASTRESASATAISATASLLCAVAARLAAALLDEPDTFDAHAALHRLDHVIDGQAGNRNGGQRFH